MQKHYLTSGQIKAFERYLHQEERAGQKPLPFPNRYLPKKLPILSKLILAFTPSAICLICSSGRSIQGVPVGSRADSGDGQRENFRTLQIDDRLSVPSGFYSQILHFRYPDPSGTNGFHQQLQPIYLLATGAEHAKYLERLRLIC